MNVKVIEGFFEKTVCEEIISIFKKWRWSDATLASSKSGLRYDPNIRRGKTILLNENKMDKFPFLRKYTDLLIESLEDYNKENNRYMITDIMFQVTEYKASNQDFFEWHNDSPEKKIPRRLVSASLQLSDPNDYEGCDLQLKNFEHDNLKQQGTLIIFDSLHHHKVYPITKGERYALVVWASGSPR